MLISEGAILSILLNQLCACASLMHVLVLSAVALFVCIIVHFLCFSICITPTRISIIVPVVESCNNKSIKSIDMECIPCFTKG